jgi:O-methyltransferase
MSSPRQSDPTLYLDLIKKCLTRFVFPDRCFAPNLQDTFDFNPEKRSDGRDWPTEAETMIGLKRLDNLEACIEQILMENVPGDLVETGVWRGGASIFMRAVLKAYAVNDRVVWVADSFAGLPRPDPAAYPADVGDSHYQLWPYLSVPLHTVRANFARYDLLDDQVKFLPGWFKDTLPKAPINKISLLRLDGDMYESTMQGLQSLYPKMSAGGFVVIDDFGALPNCQRAVEDFRRVHGIEAPLQQIDWTGWYWQVPPAN